MRSKLKKLQEKESMRLQQIENLAHENEKYKNEAVIAAKKKEHAVIQLKTANQTIANLRQCINNIVTEFDAIEESDQSQAE